MRQPLLLDTPEQLKPDNLGFVRTPGPNIFARWKHLASGMVIIHCGHPTALRPYYIQAPDGSSIFEDNGQAFRKLAFAKEKIIQLYDRPRT